MLEAIQSQAYYAIYMDWVLNPETIYITFIHIIEGE